MNYAFAYLAGLGCAVSYGVATVLEQVGARREAEAKTFNPKFLLRLLHQLPFSLGVVLDTLGWLLSLAAVRELPLFLAQSFIASSMIVSTLVDRFYLHTPVTGREKAAMGTVLTGLILLGVTATPAASRLTSETFRAFLLVMPGILALVGVALINFDVARNKPVLITIVAGLAFGGTTMAGRVADFSNLGLHTLFKPMVLALITYGIVGMILFSVALQRDTVSRLNSALFATEVAVPSTLGILFLGDQIRPGWLPLAALGLLIVFGGTLLVSVFDRSRTIVTKKAQ